MSNRMTLRPIGQQDRLQLKLAGTGGSARGREET
jgi:hypothetical protein